MKRLIRFNELFNHAWHGKNVKKLNKIDLIFITNFIETNNDLSKNDFEMAVNRIFINKERPKNWCIILELLSCINSSIE